MTFQPDSKVGLNVRELADINLVISKYEEGAVSQKDGRQATSAAWQPLENMRVSLETFRQSSGVAQAIQQVKGALDDGVKKANEGLTSAATAYQDAINSLFKAGAAANRQKQIDLGGFGSASITGTLGGLLNAKDAGEALSIILKDCLPCEVRAPTQGLSFDLSFIEQILKLLEDIITSLQKFIQDLLDDGKFSTEICVQLNLASFTCLPDFKAMSLALGKGFALKLKTPTLRLPGLSDLIAILLSPIFAALAALASQWLQLIVGPVECVLRSLSTQIQKLSLSPAPILPSGKLDLQLSEIDVLNAIKVKEKKQALTLSIPGKEKIEGAAKVWSSKIDNVVAGLEKTRVMILKVKTQIEAFVTTHFVDNFKKILNHQTKGIAGLLQTLAEIAELSKFLLLIGTLKKVLQSEIKGCSSKQEAFENAKDKVPTEVAQILPGRSISYSVPTGELDPGVLSDLKNKKYLEKSVTLPERQMKILGLSNIPGFTLESLGTRDQTSASNLVRIRFQNDLSLQECDNFMRSDSFYDVPRVRA